MQCLGSFIDSLIFGHVRAGGENCIEYVGICGVTNDEIVQ